MSDDFYKEIGVLASKHAKPQACVIEIKAGMLGDFGNESAVLIFGHYRPRSLYLSIICPIILHSENQEMKYYVTSDPWRCLHWLVFVLECV